MRQFSLFAFDLLQSLGGILDVWWAHNGIVTTGSYCMAQGVIQRIGELGVALITLVRLLPLLSLGPSETDIHLGQVLAVHTFVAAQRVELQACGFAFSLGGILCVFTALWVGIGAGIYKNYETPTPFWCWISPKFPRERLAGEYIWLWLAPFTSVILYIPLFWVEGRLSVDEEKWYKFHTRNVKQGVEDTQRRATLVMLL